MRSPIHPKYYIKGVVCQITQLYGENKNRLFYGPKGHPGIDFRTVGVFKYIWNSLKGFVRNDRSKKEKEGLIPIVASHSGKMTVVYNADKEKGIGMRIRDEEKGIETFYFHLDFLRIWKNDHHWTKWEEIKGENFVREGTLIGYAGNTGQYTTGAHLHFELKKKGSNGSWYLVDPMPYFTDDIVYQRIHNLRQYQRHFYKGKEITLSNADNLINVLSEKYDKK